MNDKKIYIETIKTNENNERDTYETGYMQTKLCEITTLDTELLKTIKENINKICDFAASNLVSDELEVEFSIGVTGEGNVCILSGKGSMGIKVKLLWKKQ